MTISTYDGTYPSSAPGTHAGNNASSTAYSNNSISTYASSLNYMGTDYAP